jgi:hypothetical protein
VLMDSEACLANAVECNGRAHHAKRFEIKMQYRELAQQWRCLADQLERHTDKARAIDLQEQTAPHRFSILGGGAGDRL